MPIPTDQQLPKIIRFMYETDGGPCDDGPTAVCPHCGADGRYIQWLKRTIDREATSKMQWRQKKFGGAPLMAASRTSEGSVVVTGPGVEGKRCPSMGAALAYAMHEASRCETQDCTWYVENETTGERLAVEKQLDDTVTYIRLNGGN